MRRRGWNLFPHGWQKCIEHFNVMSVPRTPNILHNTELVGSMLDQVDSTSVVRARMNFLSELTDIGGSFLWYTAFCKKRMVKDQWQSIISNRASNCLVFFVRKIVTILPSFHAKKQPPEHAGSLHVHFQSERLHLSSLTSFELFVHRKNMFMSTHRGNYAWNTGRLVSCLSEVWNSHCWRDWVPYLNSDSRRKC